MRMIDPFVDKISLTMEMRTLSSHLHLPAGAKRQMPPNALSSPAPPLLHSETPTATHTRASLPAPLSSTLLLVFIAAVALSSTCPRCFRGRLALDATPRTFALSEVAAAPKLPAAATS